MIIIVKSVNETPEEEVERRLQELRQQGIRFRIASANTSLHPVGETNIDVDHGSKMFGVARHVYYVTTVVLELSDISHNS